MANLFDVRKSTWLLLLILPLATADRSSTIEMVSEILLGDERPTSLVTYVCWSRGNSKTNDETRKLTAATGRTPINRLLKFLAETLSLAKSLNDNVKAVGFADFNEDPDAHLPDHEIMFLLDLNCPLALKLLRKASKLNLCKAPYRWFLVGDQCAKASSTDGLANHNVTDFCNVVPAILEDIDALPDSEVTLARGINGKGFVIQSVYRRSKLSPILLEHRGYWRSSSGSATAAREPVAVRRLNLSGTLVTLCYVLTRNESIHHLTDYKHKEVDTITKVNFILTNQLVDLVNGSRAYRFVSTWGYRDDAGRWSGMIGQLTEREADVGGSPLFFTSDRVAAIDYIAMPTPTRSKFVFRQPKLSYVNNLFAMPFRRDVWLCTALLFAMLAGVLLFVAVWEWRLPIEGSLKERQRVGGVLRPNLGDAVVLAYGAACQQGSAVELRGSLGRLVIFMLFLSSMFLFTSYSANIVALLQSSSSSIRTLEDLLNSRLTFGVDDTVFNHYYFSTATEPIRRAIYQKKVAPPGKTPNFMDLETGVKEIRKGLFAFHMETGVGYKVVEEIFKEDEKCGLQEIPYLQVIDPWLAIQKNSSHKEMFKIGMRRIQEYGMQARENGRLYTRRPRCAVHGGAFVSVALVDVYPALAALLYGALAALAALGLEIIVAKRRGRGRKLDQTNSGAPCPAPDLRLRRRRY